MTTSIPCLSTAVLDSDRFDSLLAAITALAASGPSPDAHADALAVLFGAGIASDYILTDCGADTLDTDWRRTRLAVAAPSEIVVDVVSSEVH